jgi:hypothetical protein
LLINMSAPDESFHRTSYNRLSGSQAFNPKLARSQSSSAYRKATVDRIGSRRGRGARDAAAVKTLHRPLVTASAQYLEYQKTLSVDLAGPKQNALAAAREQQAAAADAAREARKTATTCAWDRVGAARRQLLRNGDDALRLLVVLAMAYGAAWMVRNGVAGQAEFTTAWHAGCVA